MAAKILIVEDEEKLARFTELELQHENYEVRKAFDGRSALEEALKNDYDLILLDIMLPGLNGMEVLRRLRQEKNTPVILLTARDSVMDKVAGLDAGAVDYITKPFAIEELLARIRVALKFRSAGAEKTAAAEEGVLSWKALRLDDVRKTVDWGGQRITLTNREFLMLKTMLENRAFPRNAPGPRLRLRLRGRDQYRGRVRAAPQSEDRRGLRGKDAGNGERSRLCHPVRITRRSGG